jgi:hypothetical protein
MRGFVCFVLIIGVEGNCCMKKGVIAYVDFLGTKGIWVKHDPEQVLRKLRHLRDTVLSEHLKLGRMYLKDVSSAGGPSIKCQAIFVSDTIALAFWYDTAAEEDRPFGPLVYMAGKVIAELIRESASLGTPPSRALRGCITEGKFDFDESFLIGPAVDEAGSCHEQAGGAFVFLSPPTDRHLNEQITYLRYLVETGELTREEACRSPEATLFIPYEIPLKKTGTVQLPVLNPLAGEDAQNHDEIIQSVLTAFDDSDPGVEQKKANTAKFLEYCKSFKIDPFF